MAFEQVDDDPRGIAAAMPRAMRDRLFPRGCRQCRPGLVDELTFGAVWSRPALALPDRMIATLAALCSVKRLSHLHR